MNAVNAMLRDQQEAELAAAVESANKWLDLARPIILATFKLDDVESDLMRGCDFKEYHGHRTRTMREASEQVNKARLYLADMLDGIRDDFLCDERKPYLDHVSDAENQASDEFNDALDDETLSVKDAIKRVEREWNAA